MEIGRVEALYRYPVKSMAGQRLEAAGLGWHGLDGDRRLALRRLDDRGGFPWLTASKLAELLLLLAALDGFQRREPDVLGHRPGPARGCRDLRNVRPVRSSGVNGGRS